MARDKRTIAVFGATGRTGRALIGQAVAAGHPVVAVARRPGAIGVTHPGLRVVGAQLTDADALADALNGVDVVVSVLGVPSLRESRKGTTVHSAGTRAIRQAMTRAGVRRIVVVSSGGVQTEPMGNWVYTHVVKRFFLAPVYADMRVMEEELRAGDLDWTIVRPSYLRGEERRTDYRTALDGPLPGDGALSRWGLAHLLLRTATDSAYRRRVVSVSG